MLFQQALRVGKRSRAETDIDHAAPTLVSAALAHATTDSGDLAGRRVVVIGAGTMAGLATATVRQLGAEQVTVVNRTLGPGGPARRGVRRRRDRRSTTCPPRSPAPTW